jgi:hypothetical protein
MVNARHIKNVPERKTDIGDARWLAALARWLGGYKDRLYRRQDYASCVRLGRVVSDLHGQSARVVVKTIIAGQSPHEVLKFASRRLKASREEVFDALQCDLTASHHFVLDELMPHIEKIEARIARFDAKLLDELKDEHNTLARLQTLPGVDLMGTAMLLVEMGTDMNALVAPIIWHQRSVSAPVTRRQIQIWACPQGQPLCSTVTFRVRSCR